MMMDRRSRVALHITWAPDDVTTCFTQRSISSVRVLLGEDRIKVQSGRDGPEDTVVVVTSARYIVLENLEQDA